MKFFSLMAVTSMVLMGASSCQEVPLVVDASAMALKSGQATMVLGGCQRPLTIGYDACWVEKGATLPKLTMTFVTAAEYAISDCKLGLFKTGSVDAPGVVDVDITPLSSQLSDSGFCMLRVEAVEYYKDKGDPSQIRQIPLAGGWFIEAFDKGYMPTPTEAQVGWCYVVRRTTAGRTVMAPCK